MSNKARGPKGYTNKSVKELQQASQQLLFALGQAHYNEEFSIREQNRIQDALEEIEETLNYAARQEAAKNKADTEAAEKRNEEVRAETTQTQTETPSDSQV